MKYLKDYDTFLHEKKVENTEKVKEMIRDMFLKYGPDGITNGNINKMLKSSQWINLAGSESKLKKIWKEYTDKDSGFAYQKGRKWFAISYN